MKSSKSEEQMIYLIKRGNCTFYTKSQYAQWAGAKMVIIMDDVQENENYIKLDKSKSDNKQPVTIPTVMLDKKSSQLLSQYLIQNNSRVITVSFEFSLKSDYDGKVHLEYWYQGYNNESLEFLDKFGKVIGNLLKDKNFLFQPRHVTWKCYFCQIFSFLYHSKECISSGKYCANNPKEGPNKGMDLVMEDVRQICLFKIHPNMFFGYLENYRESCASLMKPLENCSLSLIQKLFGNETKNSIDKCFKNSFESDNYEKSENVLMKIEHDQYNERGVQIYPSLYVNGEEYQVHSFF